MQPSISEIQVPQFYKKTPLPSSLSVGMKCGESAWHTVRNKLVSSLFSPSLPLLLPHKEAKQAHI